ncbi:hypothetical protein ACROYT_G019542 [Oculina patagonica]
MSWAKEEWKQELSASGLQHVYDLEQRCETLLKESKQKQYQMDSLQASIAKQKKLLEEEKANASLLKKENYSLGESIQDLERKLERNLHDLNAKDGQIRCLDGKLSRSQQMLEAESANSLQLKNELDQLQYNQNQLASKFEKQAADFSKVKEANAHLQRQLAGHKEQVRTLESQIKSLGEEPHSRTKKSSGSDSDVEQQSSHVNKLKELETSLQLEKDQRLKIEKELSQLKAYSPKLNTEESLNVPLTSELKEPAMEPDQLQSRATQLATDSELLQKIKELNERLHTKENEVSEMTAKLTEISKIKSQLDEELNERLHKKETEVSEMAAKLAEYSKVKSQLEEANAHVDALEKKAKQRELDMQCQRHNSEAVINGLNDKLKEKDKEHREEMHSQSQAFTALEKQCADLEKKSSNLQNKLDNSQKMIEAKEQDIARFKASLTEAESRSKQQSSHQDSRFTELEQKVKEQQEEYVKMKQELDKAKLTLTEYERNIEQLSQTIQEKEEDLSMKEKEIHEAQGEDSKHLTAALEQISVLKKQKADLEAESQKALQEISDEAATSVTKYELERQEVVKLKERVFHLENVVSGKEKESQKSDDMYKTLCEKLEATEVDLANSKAEWATEKIVLEEKERFLQSSLEAMKNDSKAMQHDYKKACELADMKSAETTDLVDKLESSQKNVRELQQRLRRTEAVLKEKESSVSIMMQEKEELSKKQKLREEEAEKKKEELQQLCADGNREMERLREVLETSKKNLDASRAECTEKENDIQKLSIKLGNVELQCQELQNSLKTFEENLSNSNEMVKRKEIHVQEVSVELESKLKILNEDLKVIKSKDEEITTLVKELNEIQERLAESCDQAAKTKEENDALLIKLQQNSSALEHKERELKEMRSMQQSECMDTESLNEKVASLSERLEKSKAVVVVKDQEIMSMIQQLKMAEEEKAVKKEESQKSDDMYKTMCEKLEATEVDLANSKAEWANEKTVLEEKERSLQRSLEAMKNDSKAMHCDYKKACELANMKSAETTDLVDKLELSQKSVHELQQRLSRTEAVLKEKESSVSVMMQEKEGLLKEQNLRKEEAEKKKEELQQLCADGNREMQRLREVLETAKKNLDASRAECTEKENDIQKLSIKLENVELQCQELQNSLTTFEGNLSNSNEMVKKKEIHVQEVSIELESKEKILSELQQQYTETVARLNELEQVHSSLNIQKDEDLKVIKSKDEEITTLVKELNEIQERLAESCDQAAKTKEENDALLIKLQQNSTALEHKETKLKEISELLEAERKKQQSEPDVNCLETENLKEEVASLSERLEKARAVIDVKDQEIMSMIQQLKMAEEEKAGLANNHDELNSLSSNLQEKNTELENRLEQLSKVLKTNQDELSIKCNLIEELQTGSEKEVAELKEQDESQKSQLLQLQEKCSHLEACVNNKESELNDLRCKVGASENTAEVQFASLTEKLTNVEKELKSKECSEQELASKLAVKENQLKDANKMVHQQSEDIGQLETQKEMLQMDLEDKDSFIESLNKKVEHLENTVLELKKKITEKEESNESLQSKLVTLGNQLAESVSNDEKNETSVKQLMQNIQTLETQLLTETKEKGTLLEELQNLQEKLNNTHDRLEEQVNEIQELRENKVVNEDKVSKLLIQLDDLEKSLSKASDHRLEMEQLLQTAEIKHEEDNTRLEMEKESAVLEWNKRLREKSQECSSALEQLEKSKEKMEQLKDTVVHLENVSTSKDQEKMKMERSYEAFREKTQKREEELLGSCKDLEEEKSSLLEKSRECQATMEALKHECKVYQQDCKKACELADLKGQEYRDVVDKLDDSQKHLQQTRHQLSCAENELKKAKDDIQNIKEEKDELSEQMKQQKEELEARIEELRCEISTGQENVLELLGQMEGGEALVRSMETEKHEVEEMLKHTKEELCKAEEKLKSFASDRDEREVIMRSKEESEKVINILQEQIQSLEASKGELKSELEHTKVELTQLQDALNHIEAQHASAMSLKDSELDQKREMTNEKEQLAKHMIEKLQKDIDSCDERARVAETKIEDLLSEKQELCSMVDNNAAEVAQLSTKNDELEHACEELKQVKESMEDRLVRQKSELEEMSSEKATLEEELSVIKMQLEKAKEQSVENMQREEEAREQKDKELEKLQNLLAARCSQVKKLQRNLSEQTEKLESLKNQVSSLSEELDTIKAEHEQCQQKDDGSGKLQEQIFELKHLLSREQSNNEAMMHAFQEQEEQWEEEKKKILSSLKSDSESSNPLIAEENANLKRKVDELQRDLSSKELECTELVRQKQMRTSLAANVKLDLETKIKALEFQCEELKYNLKQKEEEIFVKNESLKQTNLEVSSLEAKYVAAEEVERELRHHLGEVTQQLEWRRDNKPETVEPEGFSNGGSEQKKSKEDLSAAEKDELEELRVEKQDKVKWLEDQRQQIVEAAREFALQQEQTFTKKIQNLEEKLTRKDEDLQEMESAVHQLQHDLRAVQQEKNALIEASDERDREFDAEKKLWNSGSYSYETIQQYIADLNAERQNVNDLQEKCTELEEKLKELGNVNTSLQKNLGEFEKEKKLDNEEREVMEDDLYSKVDLLRSESNRLQDELKVKASTITSLTEEKAKLLISVASSEKKQVESAEAVAELQQQCDMLREQLEQLRTEKGLLQEEKDASVMQKGQEQLNLEHSVKKVQELEEKLKEDVKEKNKLSNTLKDVEGMLEQERKCLEVKTKELHEMKTILKLADKENEESVKEKETKVVELTFAYEDLRNKLNEEGKNFEEKCKELEQVKVQLKKVQEKSEEMKEDYERELDKIKFEFQDANNDCAFLREEIKELKQKSTEDATQFKWTREKKKLLHQLEESKLMLNQAKQSKEKIDDELAQANVKVITLESKAVRASRELAAGLEEIKQLKTQVSEQNSEIEKLKANADKEKPASDDITQKEEEIGGLRKEVNKLQKELKEWKAVADEKKKAAEKTLATNLKLVNKLEKLSREKGSELASTGLATVGKNPNELLSTPKPSRVNMVQAVGKNEIPVSPLAKSLSSLDIKSLPASTATVTTQPATTQESLSTTTRDCLPQGVPLALNKRDTEQLGVATRQSVPKLKKRAGEQAIETPAKRTRTSIVSQTTEQLPNGKPEVVRKANIPVPPSVRRTTTGVKTRSAAKRNVTTTSSYTATFNSTENPGSSRAQPRAQFAPPEMALSPRKTNIPQLGPSSRIPKPNSRSQMPRPNGPLTKQPKLAPGQQAPRATGDQKDCKMQ